MSKNQKHALGPESKIIPWIEMTWERKEWGIGVLLFEVSYPLQWRKMTIVDYVWGNKASILQNITP